jgi:type II secretion system protein H
MATTRTSAASTDRPRRVGALAGRSEAGFTLLEVIVAMVIVGVVASMVLPSIQAGARQSAVRRSVRSFISAARQASARAVSTRRPTALIVWPDEGTFGVEGSQGRYELPDFAEFGDIEGGVDAEGDEEIRFDFYPTGSSVGGSVEIEFTPGDRRQSWRLVLDPLISRVRIEELS